MQHLQSSPLRTPRRRLDPESQSWWKRLHGAEPIRSSAVADLHARLRREAAFQIRDRVRDRAAFPRSDIDDLATEAADDALMVLLRKLDEYRGESMFWTWARRFAAVEAPVSIRRRVGRDRVGIAPNPELALDVADPGSTAQELLEARELLEGVSEVVATRLTKRQRTVLIAVAVNGVSPQALADELDTTPGAIHKSLHDARVKIKLAVAA
jgi:RNA polymerase sigma-70 factor (ECF subfamily)